jgi:pilus assembly protein TadC
MPRKTINNNEKTSYYEGIFGKGEEAKMYFAFRLIPILVFSMCVVVLLSFVASYFLKIDILPILGVVVPIFSAPLTFMLGYLFGDKRKETS